MASRVAVLEEKIENLVSKVDRMRKRRTELQAKVQAAEDRAAAAEAALAASVHNANTISTDNEQGSKLKTELEKEKEKVRNRKLEKEKERNRKWEELTVAKDKRQKATIRQPKKVLDKESIKRDAKPRNSQDIAQKRTRESTLINEDLEAQPLAAAGQVSEAFTRISSTQDDMERISKEKNETNYAHAKLIKEHERISNELEKTRAALTRAEKDIEDKTKDIEEIAAARKAAQEGQNAATDQLMHHLSEISRLEDDFKAYKNRAHALLQNKDAQLSAVRDMGLVAAQEAALRDAQRERDLAFAQRDRAQQTFEDGIEIGRVVSLMDAEQRIRHMEKEFEYTKAQMQSQEKARQRESHRTLSEVHEQWNLKYKALEAQKSRTDEDLNSSRMNYEKLKVEHDSFREMANKIVETKDNEISRLLDDNNNLQRSLRENHLVLARQQAQREEELAQRQRHIEALQEEIAELERENRLHHQQEVMLKSELRNMDRVQKRDGVDMTYLKNVILKLLETGEVEALLPVIGTLLQFSPEEIRKCQETYNAVPNVPLSGAAAVVDAAASAPRSCFSRFTL